MRASAAALAEDADTLTLSGQILSGLAAIGQQAAPLNVPRGELICLQDGRGRGVDHFFQDAHVSGVVLATLSNEDWCVSIHRSFHLDGRLHYSTTEKPPPPQAGVGDLESILRR